MIEISNQGEIDLLCSFVNKSSPENIKIKLFVNNITPKKDYSIHNFIELSHAYYDDIILDANRWVPQVAKIEDIEANIISYADVLFTIRGFVGTIYGYYAVGVNTSTLKFYSVFDNPYKINVEGATIKTTLNLIAKQFIGR